ncbi:MAG: superoxide dismutase, Ni [Thermoplasmata archaeon]|nr:superoxide dismutase, Ni [Thermoplasmata archaeon]MCI4338016.1 superoxide dismutase, Ni [Thermoplasmata archaeon]MCI4340902.1 superoxide dismutase, Ni [Thermoplasmata archaeon]
MFVSTVLRRLGIEVGDWIAPPVPVHAHCDIPCGIYDPHEAQLAALTVLRMDQLLAELKAPPEGAPAGEIEKYHSQCARYVLVKERHSDRAESEIVTLWADYFTADHVKKFPDLTSQVWNTLQAIGKARRGTAVAEAEDALVQVQGVAELFWKTKDTKTVRVPSKSKAGHELVLPAA